MDTQKLRSCVDYKTVPLSWRELDDRDYFRFSRVESLTLFSLINMNLESANFLSDSRLMSRIYVVIKIFMLFEFVTCEESHLHVFYQYKRRGLKLCKDVI